MSLPSLRALRAFAEVARAGSLAEAARALHVSPSAISHLLRDLESALGFALFAGRGPGAPLSEPGARLASRLGGAFATIERAVAEARHRSGDVRVSALTSFSTLWLVPRLARLQAQHPDVRLLLATGLRPVDLATEPFDCAIRYGRGAWPGLAATLLFYERPVAVANPRALAQHGIAGLARLAARTRDSDWPLVGAALGLPESAPVLTFETRALAVQAAIAGIGATVVDRHLVAGLLVDGLLAEAAPTPPLERPEGHWFVALPEALRDRHVRAFRDWLVAEVQQNAADPPGRSTQPQQGAATSASRATPLRSPAARG